MPSEAAMEVAKKCQRDIANRMDNDAAPLERNFVEKIVAGHLDAFAAERVEAMRERCAVVIDDLAYAEECKDTINDLAKAKPYRRIAAAIRALPADGGGA